MPARSLISVALAAACMAPAAASASTISSQNGLLTFRSGAAASDLALTADLGNGLFTFADAGDTLIAEPDCTQGPPVTCPASSFHILLGSGDDRARIHANFDIFESGGAGDDELYAWGLGATTTAGSGNDLVIVDTNGSGFATGDAGDDTLYGTGAGTNLAGGAGDDFALANATTDNTATGGAGADVLVGRSASPFGSGGALSGGPGDDVLAPRFGGSGDTGPWTLDGGPGDDVIAGSPDVDTVDGGPGADTIDVSADGQADTVACGPGNDEVWADDVDTVAADCEVVHREAAPELPAVTAALNAAATLAANVAGIDPFTPGPMFG